MRTASSERERDWVLPSEPASIARARRAVSAVCAEWGYGVCEDAELVTSELVTNALRHGGTNLDVVPSAVTEIQLRIADIQPGLRIEVGDNHPAPPTPSAVLRLGAGAVASIAALPGGEGGEGGYGLLIVGRLASWGWHSTPRGKVVWAELRPPDS